MKKQSFRMVMAIVFAVNTCLLFGAPPTPPSGYTWSTVVSDDFNSFNTTTWGSGSTPWGSENQSSCTLIPASDTYVSGGSLELRSRAGSFTGATGTVFPYTSGWAWLRTWRTYGYIEIRAQYPNHRGAWPAFWMLGDGWPPEIDVMEWRGAPKNYMTMALYTGTWNTTTRTGTYTDWHVYGLEWAAGTLKWYIDGVVVKTINSSTVPSIPMYVILSNGTDCADGDGTGFPNYYNIDYFRWYQLQGSSSSSSSSSSSGGSVANGVYRISPSHATNQAVEMAGQGTANGTNIQQWAYWGGNNQRWTVTNLGTGFYSIRPVNASGQSMDVDSWSTADGANVMSWAYAGGTNQQFQLVANGSGYKIKPRHSGKCVDISGASTANGANVLQWTCNGGANQRFIFTRLSSAENQNEISSAVSSLAVYPNPVSNDVLTIKTMLNVDSEVRITIYNTQGQKVFDKNIGMRQSGELAENLNVQNISEGVYVMGVEFADQVQKTMFIRQ
jgi:beta-glucanase (GH16 family)